MGSSNLEEAIQDWIKWEKENELHAPQHIREAGKRNFRSEREQKDREIRYATGRTWNELKEALEVGRAVEKSKAGEEVDYSQHFEYTAGNEMYNTGSKSNHEQLLDEFGFELADVALFTLKITTAVEKDRNNTLHSPETSELAGMLNHKEGEIQEPVETLEEISNRIDPNSSGEIYTEIMSAKTGDQEVFSYTQETLEKLSGLASRLPKGDLSSYVSEKIRYNIEERDIENMDADHPLPEPEFRRKYEEESMD